MMYVASSLRHPLRVAVMVDLTRGATAGGHVKCWERFAQAATAFGDELDLTVFFSGERPDSESVAANVRYRALPPVFSTRRLAFLTGDIPDHTDIAPWHPRLAAALGEGFDVLHTTDAYFAFARTAARVSWRTGTPLVNSVHTATPALTRLFARQTIVRMVGEGTLGRLLIERLELPERAERGKLETLRRYQAQCSYALVSRQDDRNRALTAMPAERVRLLRRGIDHRLFSPAKRDRAWLDSEFGVPPNAVVVLFVGRMDVSKNIGPLAEGVRLAAEQGAPLVLFCAGEGNLRREISGSLGARAVCPGQIDSERLARVYASADLFALPSEIEVFGNAVIEALASGVPVLVAERGGMGMAIEPGRTGIVVPAGGARFWAEALLSLARDPNRLAAMRAAVRASELLMDWERVLAEDLLPVWRAAAGEKV